MEMIFYKPRNATLQKYLEGYYFIAGDKGSDVIRYRTFPNNYTILSASYFTDVLYEENKITVVPSAVKEISVDVVFRYSRPIDVFYENAVDEVTFYFKPLGLNHFIKESDHLSKQASLMDFYVFPDFNAKMIEIFKMQNRERQIEELERYWLSKLQVRDFTLMEQLLEELEASDLRIEEIARKFNISRQYMSKLFLRYIGKSAVEYRKVHRFRKTLKKKPETGNLTALCYENLFYDQSHLHKDFKEFTNSSPSNFFRNVDTEKQNVWLFI